MVRNGSPVFIDSLPSCLWFADASGAMPQSVVAPGSVFVSIETDSRAARANALFVALPGERTDGHAYVFDAMRAGCSAALVQASWFEKQDSARFNGLSVIVVEDTFKALQKAATAYRASFPSLLRFGITGSSGKTSVKEILAAIMGEYKHTVKSPGNRNSDIGLAASVFCIRPEHEAAVFELGINRPHEMEELAAMYEPDCALINNIGSAHIGVLGGTREDIARHKKAITTKFTGSQRLIIWEDDDFADYLSKDIAGCVSFFGPRSTAGFEGARDLGGDGWALRYKGLEFHLRLAGAHNVLNTLAAVTAADMYGARPEHIASGVESVHPVAGRSEIRRGLYTIVDDTYNANAESVIAAIALCDALPVNGAARRIYVLGSMKELGSDAEKAHRRVGEKAALSKADIVFFYGEETKVSADAVRSAKKDVRHFTDYEKLEREVMATVRSKDTILVKASRSMALERLVHTLSAAEDVHVS